MTYFEQDVYDGFEAETLAIRAGHHRTNEMEHSEPLFLTSSYVFNSAEEAEARFNGSNIGNVYSRYTNPTVRIFEQRLAALEEAESCVATSSGMAAILALVMSICNAGDHLLVSKSVFGSTINLFEKYLVRFGLHIDYVDLQDLQQWQEKTKINTKLYIIETPSNPLASVADITALAEIAHSNKAKLAVDNCFCTPILQKPLKHGADFSLHSATKYIDGQGRVLGGAVCGRKKDIELLVGFNRTCGTTLSPFNAWVLLKGLETLSLRILAQSENAADLANWLKTQEKIKRVYYSGLPEHIGHSIAEKQQKAFGAVLSFELHSNASNILKEIDSLGGVSAFDTVHITKLTAFKFINATKMISITTNLGDTKTTISHPATTSHGRLTEKDRLAAGITQGLIRISVGLENLKDIKNDLLRGLNSI